MLFKNVRIAFRNILRQKGYNLLNVIGLATGMACGLIIALHIREELSYEKEFENSENIYRVHVAEWAKSSPPLAEALNNFFPEVDQIGRLANYGTSAVSSDDGSPGEFSGYFADSTILDIFGMDVVEGNRKQALATPGTLVITKSMAKHFFGDESAVNKVLHVAGESFPVVAVIEDLPKNTHLSFDFLVSMPTFYKRVPDNWTGNRGWMVMYTYMSFLSPLDFAKAKERMPDFLASFYEGADDLEERISNEAIRFQKLTDIHLGGNKEQEMNPNGNILYIYILMAIEGLILLVASANFMSLFTTQAIKRLKEVGMRKILGAKAYQLIWQFFTEVLLLTGFSLLLAIVLYQAVIPAYNAISGRTLEFWQIFMPENLAIIGSIALAVVLIAGLYPAIFIAGFRSASFLRDHKLPASMPNIVRNGLVVFQFVVSIFLIASTILVRQQMNLIESKDLGFDKDHVVNLKLYGAVWWKAMHESQSFKNELLRNPDVLAVGKVNNLIGDNLSVEGVVPVGREEEEFPSVRVIRVDEDYLDAMNIPVVAGRNFSLEHNDSASFIINESAAKVLGLEDPVGKLIINQTMGLEGQVVGVVKDYHFASLHAAIEPLVIEYRPQWTGHLVVKIRGGKTRETIQFLEKTVKSIAPDALFVYSFLDDRLNSLYTAESNMASIFQFFSILAIIIACLGLFGLSAHAVENRIKEIGIRKVLGATVSSVMVLVSSGFFKLILIAFVVAVPITWYAMDIWLQNFAFQIEINFWVFIITGIASVAIAFFAVGYNTISAATSNPVESLRYE